MHPPFLITVGKQRIAVGGDEAEAAAAAWPAPLVRGLNSYWRRRYSEAVDLMNIRSHIFPALLHFARKQLLVTSIVARETKRGAAEILNLVDGTWSEKGRLSRRYRTLTSRGPSRLTQGAFASCD